MLRITMTGPLANERCDNCGDEKPVLRITDGAMVLIFICQACLKEMTAAALRQFSRG